MKKIISIIAIFILYSLLIFTPNAFALTLDAISVNTDKTTVRPGEEVKVTIEFGASLGAYTFDIAYDNNLFEYVSVDGGTPNDTSDKVRVVFHDSSGGSNPRTNMSITFRAKEGITTSNPTEFSITAEGMTNPDASDNYDDIVVPITKDVTVEPEYIDYTLDLTYTGDIIKNEEKEMVLSYSSPMGKYYQKARLIAEAQTTSGGTVRLLGTDQSQMEHDIIQSGWGDSQGYEIGGKDVSQVLNVRAIFSEAGEYTITLKLIDRENADGTIAEKQFSFTVAETPTTPSTPNPSEPEQTIPTEPEENQPETITPPEEVAEEVPTTLPKTGYNINIPIILTIILVSFIYVVIQLKEKTKNS